MFQLLIHVDFVDHPAQAVDIVDLHDRIDLQIDLGPAHPFQDAVFLALARIGDVQLEHVAVDLRLGQVVGAFLLHGILGG